MRPLRALFAALAVPLLSPPAAASEAPRHALSVHPLALSYRGAQLQAERSLDARWSAAVSLGLRRSGGAELDTTHAAYGAELRRWFGPGNQGGAFASGGAHLGLRVDLGLVGLSRGDRWLGSSLSAGPSLHLGYRFVFSRRVEITPSLGVGLRLDADPSGRLSPWLRAEPIKLGVTAGILF